MDEKIKNLGIIGGTFDPIHFGHIGCAEAAANTFDLDEVWFVPANHPNFKLNKSVTDITHRLHMVKLALDDAHNSKFKISNFEANRQGITYTSDTLEILHKDFPKTNLYFVIGTDSLFTLPKWHNFETILKLSTIIAVTRKGYFEPTENQAEFIKLHSDAIEIVEADVIGISSSEIREKISNGENVSGLLPQSVEQYIKKYQIY